MIVGQSSTVSGQRLIELISNFRRTLVGVALLSGFLNLLVIGGALLVMVLFDTIMPSHSLASLLGLLLFSVVSVAFYGFFSLIRARLILDMGVAVHDVVTERMPAAIHYVAMNGGGAGDGLQPIDDVEDIRSFLSSSTAPALFDLPWAVLALLFLFFAHVWLGVAGLFVLGAVAGICFAVRAAAGQNAEWLAEARSHRRLVADEHRRHAESVQALGLVGPFQHRWLSLERRIGGVYRNQDRQFGAYDGLAIVLRLIGLLVVFVAGIWLSFNDRASVGVVVAAGLLLFQMLSPVERSISGWRAFTAARNAWKRLDQLLPALDPVTVSTTLPAPKSMLEVSQLAICSPGSNQPLVQNVGFRLEGGEALGIVGATAVGKTVLLRAIAGIWRVAHGEIRLDGATLDQWNPQELTRHIGYLPQCIELLSGTIGQNIARFDPSATSEEVIAAAKAAGIHDMVLRLPEGYQTRVGRDGRLMTAGQRQRIGLARALFRDPFLVILDDPNSQVDPEGDEALAQAIMDVRARRGIVVMVTYRHNLLQYMKHVMILRNGMMGAFGPAERMLKRTDISGGEREAPAVIEAGKTEH